MVSTRSRPGVGAATIEHGSSKPNRKRRVGFVVTVAVVAGALTLRWMHTLDWSFVDLVDFVEGGRSVLSGRQVYDAIPGVLPFNYPPFGAVVMAPLALVGLGAAETLWTLLSLAAYGVLVVVVARRLRLDRTSTAVIAIAGLALEPLIRHLVLGQVNLVLAALVVLDLFVVPRRYRGIVIGIAAGVKLTPAVFAVQFLLKRDWASAVRSLLTFIATIALGWLVAPASSSRYWLEDLDKTARFGGDALMSANQSLRAVVVRATSLENPPLMWWAPLAGLALTLCVWVAARRIRAADDVGAMLALALGGLLASPISWSHHWVWVVPAIMYAVAARRLAMAWVVAGVFYVAPMWLLPAGGAELRLYAWQVAVSATYVVVGLVLLLILGQRNGGSPVGMPR
ncbi:MAG: glycosyltransferase 87 family protein [Lapillicoccus sp.]